MSRVFQHRSREAVRTIAQTLRVTTVSRIFEPDELKPDEA